MKKLGKTSVKQLLVRVLQRSRVNRVDGKPEREIRKSISHRNWPVRLRRQRRHRICPLQAGEQESHW